MSSLLGGCLVDFGAPGNMNGNSSEYCGNGVWESGELCDGTDFHGQTCSSAGSFAFGELRCNQSCTLDLAGCHNCGNGTIDVGEECDQGNHSSGDGCSDLCAVELGWTCAGEPSLCSTTCGDGIVVGVEECDDNDSNSGDGCSANCQMEPGWVCVGQPSVCSQTCGDGVVEAPEACDDLNLDPGDGCSPNCTVEAGWSCEGSPSSCEEICGDGLVTGAEACDDGNSSDGDGCSSGCSIELGWTCEGSPSACSGICGDGLIRGDEACDDGNIFSADGCSNSCAIEDYAACDGSEPSDCACVVFVDRDVPESSPQDGSGWASAFRSVAEGIFAAMFRAPCEVWVAEGTYYTYGSSDNDTLYVYSFISLFGGFAGSESWRSQRDFVANVTVLSGLREGSSLFNVQTILTFESAVGTVVDGFSISSANNATGNGGGASVRSGSDVTFRNCIFENNSAENGAAVYVNGSSAQVTGSTFSNNSADSEGGAILARNNASLTVEQSVFASNSAIDSGGAIYVEDVNSFSAERSYFLANTSLGWGGAIALSYSVPLADISASVFWQNHADDGGGALTCFHTPLVNVRGCTFHANTAPSGSGQSIRTIGGEVFLTSSIIWGSPGSEQFYSNLGGVLTFEHCDSLNPVTGPGVFSEDPLFVFPASGDLRLQASSPCVDQGDGSLVPTLDVDGLPRVDIQSAPNGNVGTPGYVDIGAHERQL